MGLIATLLLVVVPIVEIWVAIQVGQAIGVFPTIVLLLGFSVLGAVLIKHGGVTAWRRFGEAVEAGRAPGKEVVDGMLVLAGGLLMLPPGFITDAIGLVLVLPPTRAGVRWLVWRYVRKRVHVVQPTFVGPIGADGRRAPAGGGPVIDVEVLDSDDDAPTGPAGPTGPATPTGRVIDVNPGARVEPRRPDGGPTPDRPIGP